MRLHRVIRKTIPTVFALCLLGPGVAAAAAVQPAAPQPSAAELKPGLSVVYYYKFYRWVDELAKTVADGPGEAGPPLPLLNYRVGLGTVLTSHDKNGVGAHIQGFIHLQQAGSYQFAVQSNDGVRITLGGSKILEDPDVHPDSWSDVATVDVTTPGWYPLDILYFERKNTSTLRLYWKKPGATGRLKLIPASAYAHR